MITKNTKVLFLIIYSVLFGLTYSYSYADDDWLKNSTEISSEINRDYVDNYWKNYSTYENAFSVIDNDYNSWVINKATWKNIHEVLMKKTTSNNVSTTSKYDEYYKMFKEKYLSDLENWDFDDIKKEMQGFLNDAEYLSQNPTSPYYNNMELYKIKAQVLNDLINKFSNNNKVVKENYLNEKKQMQETLKKFSEFKKDLEEELSELREEITSENLDEKLQEFDELKTEFLEKAKSEFSNVEASQKIIEQRFEIFYKNQFELRKNAINAKEKIKSEVDKQEIKKEYLEKKQEVKSEVKKLKDDIKDTRAQMVSSYKTAFSKQISSRLDQMSEEKLNIVLNRINLAIEKYSNSKLSETKKQKVLAQLEALKLLVEEKLNITDEVNIEELLN